MNLTEIDATEARKAANARRVIRRHIVAAGYSAANISAGMAWAEAQGFDGAREGYILTMSHILYGADDLARGARFGVADGHGPR